MSTRTARLIAAVLALAATCASAWAAGPAGHYLIGKTIVDGALKGQTSVPAELKEALSTPEGRRSFYGGAVGPDICEGRSHYGNTADLAQSLLHAAQADLESAKFRRSADEVARAQREVAFAYGWMAHCGTDLNVHPKINALVGDTFRFNSSAEQKEHGAWEAQFTAYLEHTLGKSAGQFDVSVPFDFLSRVSGVDDAKLRQGLAIVKAKTMAELAFAGKVTLSDAELARMWRAVAQGSRADSLDYMRNPGHMGNWDLDCGQIGTRDFDELRELAKQANGGALPKDWGSKYMAWWKAVKGLSHAQRLAKLRELMGKTPTPQGSSADTVGPGQPRDLLTMLRATKAIRVEILGQTEMHTARGSTQYWNSVLVPADRMFPWPGLAGAFWTFPHASWHVSGDDGIAKTEIQIELDMAPDGASIRRLVAHQKRSIGPLRDEVDLDLRDLPLSRRIVGVPYSWEVQYAAWGADEARQCMASSAMRQIDRNDGSLYASGKGFQWSARAEKRPPILVRFVP